MSPRPRRPQLSSTRRGLGSAWQRLRIEAFRMYGDRCHLCGFYGADTIDHLDPRAIHGIALPTLDRVRPAHKACNSRRGSRPMPPPTQSRQW